MNYLKNKVAIVTGGGTGIGRGVAIALAKEGVRVVVCGRREKPLNDTLKKIKEICESGLAMQADVVNEAEVLQLVETTLKTYGRIDILVNNAGIYSKVNLHDLDVESWDSVMDINLRGPLLLTRFILPYMREQRSGHIINISSESGLEYYEHNGAYGLSKHALNALGEYTQKENQEFNIRVNTICPGMVVSEMTENEPDLNLSKCLVPEDIAELVLWLLTRRSNIKIGTPILIQTMQNPWE